MIPGPRVTRVTVRWVRTVEARQRLRGELRLRTGGGQDPDLGRSLTRTPRVRRTPGQSCTGEHQLFEILTLDIILSSRSGNKSTLNLTDPSAEGGDGEEEVTTYQVNNYLEQIITHLKNFAQLCVGCTLFWNLVMKILWFNFCAVLCKSLMLTLALKGFKIELQTCKLRTIPDCVIIC